MPVQSRFHARIRGDVPKFYVPLTIVPIALHNKAFLFLEYSGEGKINRTGGRSGGREVAA
jgi:hypothetical protein